MTPAGALSNLTESPARSGPRVGVFHPGTQHSWQTAVAFQEDNQLGWYATSIFYDPAKWPYKLAGRSHPLGARLRGELQRRYTPSLSPEHVRQMGAWEWVERGMERYGSGRVADWCNRRGNSAFGRAVISLLRSERVDAVWGYDTAAAEVFRWAKEHGVFCVLDQTIGHPAAMNDVMLAERERNAEFFQRRYVPFDAEWIDRQNEEMELADIVVVGSVFCAATMVANGCAPGKIRIVPYGFDEVAFSGCIAPSIQDHGPLRCVFLGQITPRKGVAYLLKAFQDIRSTDASLTLIGPAYVPERTLARFSTRVTIKRGVLRTEVATELAGAECFVLPSLFEGGGIVLYEACGAGLGIVQSDRCGDGVQGGANGIVLPEISVEAIVTAVGALASDRQRLLGMRQAAWALRETRTWAAYRSRVRELLAQELGCTGAGSLAGYGEVQTEGSRRA